MFRARWPEADKDASWFDTGALRQASDFLHFDPSRSTAALTVVLCNVCSELACLAEEAVLPEQDMTLTWKSLTGIYEHARHRNAAADVLIEGLRQLTLDDDFVFCPTALAMQ